MSRYASREAQEAEQALRDVQARTEGNNYCADCGHPRPEFINLTIGTFICQLCTEIHRSMSNRRIKDMLGGDITIEDVRRMDSVGNDMANRKFLATWNPREVPEPDRRDKEMLREFIWLKYEGSFKKPHLQRASPPAPPTAPPREYRSDDRYYDDRAPPSDRAREFDRDRGGYRREQDLFREGPQSAVEGNRSYWASRYDTARPAPPPPAPPRQREDFYGHGQNPTPPYPDRYRPSLSADRFQPPQPRPIVPYGRPMRSTRGRYNDQPAAYEDYASLTSEDRDDVRRKPSASRSRRRVSPSPEGYGYSDGELEAERSYRKSKSSKDKDKYQRRKTTVDGTGDSYYSEEEEEDSGEIRGRRSKKSDGKKSKKSTKESKSKKRADEEEDEEYEEEEEEYDEEIEEATSKKSKRSGGKKSDKRSERDRDSIVTTSVDGLDVGVNTSAQQGKSEFDLMSEWMGDSKDTDASSGTAAAQNAGSPSTGAIPAAMQQAYATQVPMMAPPMSMYGGMMPLPGGGFMPVMTPSFVPGMGIPGMPPMAPGMNPGMAPPNMPPGVGAPGVQMPGRPGGAGGVGMVPIPQGLMNGMQNMTLNPAQNANAQPPPPPPMGVPAGPAPGPPPEPPLQ